MPSKGVPFKIEDWQSVIIRGLEILNRNNWFPMLTLMVGNPGETDEDVMATLDLIYEMERRGLFGFLVPSVFTPLEGTRMEHGQGVTETKNLSRLQWQLILRCWKMDMRPGLYSWWGPASFKIGGGGGGAVGAATAQDEWTQLHLADDDVLQRAARELAVRDGQALQGSADRGEDTRRAARLDQAKLLEVSPRRYGRYPTRGDVTPDTIRRGAAADHRVAGWASSSSPLLETRSPILSKRWRSHRC